MTDVNCRSDKGDLTKICEIHEAVAGEWQKLRWDKGRFLQWDSGQRLGFILLEKRKKNKTKKQLVKITKLAKQHVRNSKQQTLAVGSLLI